MKQKELAEKYGVTPMQIGKIRKEVCDASDYCEKTRELSPEGAKKIDKYIKKKDDKIIEPKFVNVQALRSCLNNLFWECKLLDKNPKKIIVSIPNTHISLIRPNLLFKAQEIEKNNEKFYRHEIIYRREFIRNQKV